MARWFRRREAAVDDTEVLAPVDRPVVEDRVVEERVYEEPPPRRPPPLWPWLLLLLLLVLGGAAAFWYFTREDDKEVVPAVVGLSVDAATQRLTADGFRTIVDRRASARPRGRVFAQTPGGGSQLDEGEAVTILVSTGPRLVTVPGVIGLRLAAARERLRTANLRTRERGVFAEQPRGVVVAQDPRGGERIAPDSRVRINISKGTGRVDVPLVIGRTAAEAGSLLRRAGLTARTFEVPSDEPAGTVVAQNPQPGSQVARGDAVRINVSTGEAPAGGGGGGDTGTTPTPQPREVEVPNTIGQSIEIAQDRLQQRGFVVRVDFVPSDQPQGRVVAQNPAGGTPLRRGSNVRINVSEGPQPQPRRAVPDVVLLTEQEARAELERAGFRVRVFEEATPDPAEEGLVLRQEPQAGRSIPRRSLVTIYVGTTAG